MIFHLSFRFLAILCLAATAAAEEPRPKPAAKAPAAVLFDHYQARDYFALEKALAPLKRGGITGAFFEGVLAAAFLQHEEAEEKLGRFLRADDTEEEWEKEAWMALGGSRMLHGKYAGAAEAFERGLAVPGATFKADEKREVGQSITMMRALRDTPAMAQDPASGEGRLAAYRDKAGLLNVDVGVNGQAAKAIFDTGANFSCASETFARHHGLRLLPGSVEVQAATGATVPAQLGIADQVQLGPRRFSNVVFLVFRDEALAFPPIGYEIHAIVGLPLIAPLGRVRVSGDDASVDVGLPSEPAAAGDQEHTLALDGLMPIVAVQYGKDTLPFRLDTGGVQSELDARFAHFYPAALAKAKAEKQQRGSAGGVVGVKARTLPEIQLGAGGKSVTLHGIPATVSESPWTTAGYGVVGRDFLAGGFEMDFRRMRFSLLGGGKAEKQ